MYTFDLRRYVLLDHMCVGSWFMTQKFTISNIKCLYYVIRNNK